MHLYRVRKERPLHCGLWKAWCCWQFSIVGGFTAQGLYQLIPDIHLLISLKDEDLDFSDHFTFPGVLCWISPWVLFSFFFFSMLFLVRRKVNSVPARAAELSLSTWLYCHWFWQHIAPSIYSWFFSVWIHTEHWCCHWELSQYRGPFVFNWCD